jgi:pSer/pThr/pTyr-binding forkhead associated (FHA) protein
MTATDVRERLLAEAREQPFLLFTDGAGRRRVVELAGERLTIGRRPSADLSLAWDEEVSRLHAELVFMGSDWVACDDGLSRNGTYVNDERLRGRRRLREGDVLAIGATRIEFCVPCGRSTAPPTRVARDAAPPVALTPAQRRVLEVLTRPLRASGYAAPASNREIAAELYLSIDTVKGTLSALFEQFQLESLPQNQKRAALAIRTLTLV